MNWQNETRRGSCDAFAKGWAGNCEFGIVTGEIGSRNGPKCLHDEAKKLDLEALNYRLLVPVTRDRFLP